MTSASAAGQSRTFFAFLAAALLILCALGGCGGVSASPSSQSEGITPDTIVVSISPTTAIVPTGSGQVFATSVTGTGAASTAVVWSVNGVAGGNSAVGTVVPSSAATALYTAPTVPPSQATVTVTATSLADGSKSASASVTITCAATDSISPSAASVALGQSTSFTASFCVANGIGIAWDVDGVPNGNSVVGTIAATSGAIALYTAPTSLPSPDPVSIQATAPSSAGALATASATVTITSDISVSISPSAATIAARQRVTFMATVSNTSDISVTWSVNGVTNGNSVVGQICDVGSDPCIPPAGPFFGRVDYLAPDSPPATNPVTLTATSHADPSRSGTAVIIVSAASSPVSVVVSPACAFLAPSSGTLSTQQFSATVTGSTNKNISWSVQSGVASQGCAGAACGSVSATGVYAAPTIAPSPNAITVIATSQADPTKSAFATVALTNGPVIESIVPSSVMAGAAESFPLSVQGANFAAGSGSSMILLNGVPRSTTCATPTACTTMLNPVDVQTAGTLTIQIQNPGSPGALSNLAPMVVEPFDISAGTISLSSVLPAATGRDIIVVEPTTAASSLPISVDFIGYLSGANTCGVQGSPLTVTRPVSGFAVVPICVHGNGLDAAYTYAFTGPGGGLNDADIVVTASPITGLLPNMVELQLQIATTTLPGVRSLFVTTRNGDQAVATGMLEVQ